PPARRSRRCRATPPPRPTSRSASPHKRFHQGRTRSSSACGPSAASARRSSATARRSRSPSRRPASLRAVEDRGPYVAYTFYRLDPAGRRLPIEERAAGKDAFAETVESFASSFQHLRTYSCTGVRPDCDFFLWKISDRYDLLGELGTALNATPLAGWLETP